MESQSSSNQLSRPHADERWKREKVDRYRSAAETGDGEVRCISILRMQLGETTFRVRQYRALSSFQASQQPIVDETQSVRGTEGTLTLEWATGTTPAEIHGDGWVSDDKSLTQFVEQLDPATHQRLMRDGLQHPDNHVRRAARVLGSVPPASSHAAQSWAVE